MKKTNRTIDGCICPQCGKRFQVLSPRDWGYRDGATYYCSWKCIREFDAKIPPHPDTNAPQPGPMTKEQLEKFNQEDKRIAKKLQRQCTVKPAADKPKRVVRKRSSDADKKTAVMECKRLMDQEGLTEKAAAESLGVSLSTMDNWFRKFRDELGIERIAPAESGRNGWKKHPDRPRSERVKPKPNNSGEKIGRILATLARIRAGLDEISEEVQRYA